MQISRLVSQRTDLSTFLVHLTRAENDDTGRIRLEGIIESGRIEARTAYGHARQKVEGIVDAEKSQRVVCFTETPLEHVHLLVQQIDGREFQFEPYGIAISKRIARTAGVNPVWYVDMTPGHQWLTNPIDNLINTAIERGDFENSDIAKLAPFIEQMGTWPGRPRKEFWWEREWRARGDFKLPSRFIGICPSGEQKELAATVKSAGRQAVWIDAQWGLEEIIGRLAGFTADEVSVFTDMAEC